MFYKYLVPEKNFHATRQATFFLFKIYLFLGLLKPKNFKLLYYLYSAIANLVVCFLSPILFALSYQFDGAKMNISQLLTSVQVAIDICGLPFKFITVFMSLKRHTRAMAIMDTLDGRCERQDERDQIRHCAATANRIILYYITSYGLYSSSTFLSSVISGQPPYSLHMAFMDWRNTITEFAVQSLIEFTLMNFIILHQVGYDAYASIYIYVIRTHMKILVERVRKLGTDLKTSNDEHYKQLVMCIKDHQHLLSLLEVISPLISITMFIQLLVTAFILSTTLINILLFADTSARIASVIYFIGVLVQSTPCCYQAACLLHESEELSLAIMHCEWFDKEVRFRKMMIFFMMRSQTPLTLSALKLFPINLGTSLAIAKFSFSLYTLIKQMDFGQNFKK